MRLACWFVDLSYRMGLHSGPMTHVDFIKFFTARIPGKAKLKNLRRPVFRWAMETTQRMLGTKAARVLIPPFFGNRARIAAKHIFGEGIEIGALHNPQLISSQARVRYVDRYSTADLRREYPE